MPFSQNFSNFILCSSADSFVSKIISFNTTSKVQVDIECVKKAISFATQYHKGQFRTTGEPYITHPLEVASMVCEYVFTTDAIVISLLHDTLEDTTLTFQEIQSAFGQTIAEGVEALSRNKPTGKISSADLLKELWRDKKYELILIKLFDRLHNLQTISVKTPERQTKIINETLTYFLVLSEVLELPRLADSLYHYCYQANVNLGEIQTSLLELDSDFKLFDFLAVQNN